LKELLFVTLEGTAANNDVYKPSFSSDRN